MSIVTNATSQQGRSCDHSVIACDPLSGGSRVYNPGLEPRADTWYNGNRFQSFDISPYDQTLVLDSDYVVFSDRLNTLFQSNVQVTAMKNVYDITNRDGFIPYSTISGDRGLHHYWATVLYFTKGELARDFFDLMTMIRDHYRHYADLYKFGTHPFRNDFAVSIALTAVYGHVPDNIPTVPWAMANVFSDVEISTTDQDTFVLSYDDQQRRSRRHLKITGEDFHFMNKVDLAKLYAN